MIIGVDCEQHVQAELVWSYSYYRSSRPLPRGGLGGVAFLGATGETDGTLPSTRARNLAGYPFSCAKSGYSARCVWARPCPIIATVTLPVSEAPNWLGAGTPSAPGVTVAHPQGRAGPGCLFFYKYTCYVTRRVTDLLDAGSNLLCGTTIWS